MGCFFGSRRGGLEALIEFFDDKWGDECVEGLVYFFGVFAVVVDGGEEVLLVGEDAIGFKV